MTDLTDLGVAAIRDGVAAGDFTAARSGRGVQRQCRRRAGRAQRLHRRHARRGDRGRQGHRRASALPGSRWARWRGVPIGMKDLFATSGVQTTAASHILEGFTPEYESTVSQKLWDAGAGMLGKLNLDQFAMGSSNETSYFGNVISAVAAQRRRQCRAGAGRLLGRFVGGGRGAAVPGGDRHRHRRLDPPARRLHRHHRHQADLWALLALGHRRLCQLARSGRPDGARRSPTARSCSRRWPASIPRIRPASTWRCPIGKRPVSADLKGKKVGIPREYRMDGMDADVAQIWDARHRLAEGRGRRDRRDFAAAHQICAADLLHHRACRSLVEPRAL